MPAAVVMSCIGLLKLLYLPTRNTSECTVRESISQSDILTKDLIKFLYQSSLACLPFLWLVCFLFLQIIHSQCRRIRTTTDRTKTCCATITPRDSLITRPPQQGRRMRCKDKTLPTTKQADSEEGTADSPTPEGHSPTDRHKRARPRRHCGQPRAGVGW